MSSERGGGRWIVSQRCESVLALHWRVDVEAVRSLLPAGVDVEIAEGSAWITLLALKMTAVHPRLLPPVPGLSSFGQVSLRTYVAHRGRPAVWFLSLDVGRRLPAWIGRTAFHLPYFVADVGILSDEAGATTRVVSRRRAGSADLEATYRGVGGPLHVAPGSLDGFLSERLAVMTSGSGGRLYEGRVQHEPSELYDAEVELATQTLVVAGGLAAPGPPSLSRFFPGYTSRAGRLRRSRS
jgi:uncharacterized protein YqjF (DUF2071 family)